MKKILLSAFLIFSGIAVILAQTYVDAQTLTLIGKAEATPQFYHRIDTEKYSNLPEKVKSLAKFSNGLAIVFKTNSTKIWAEWKINPDPQSLNMTANAFKGVDLYIKKDGEWLFAGVGQPKGGNSNSELLVENMDNSEKECLLYLPLFSEVTSLKIGVESSAIIEAIPNPFSKKIVVHGTSIVHGVQASRAGLTYPAKLSRKTGWNFINLGFSGNARMENEMADYLADITEADAFIIDCLPNTTASQITDRTRYMVTAIRDKHPDVPVFLMQSIVFGNANFNKSVKEDTELKNENLKKIFEKLQEKGVDNLYLIEGEQLIASNQEGSGDGIHPNDLGFEQMVNALIPVITPVLNNETKLKNSVHANLNIIPNPTTGMIHIQNKPEKTDALVYGTLGNFMYKTRHSEIDFSGYDNGIYFVQIENRLLKVLKTN